MRKNRFKKFYSNVLKKKTPLLGFTVLESSILLVVISGGTAAVVANRYMQAPEDNTVISEPISEIGTNKVPSSTLDTDTQSNTQESTPQQNSANGSTTPAVNPNSLPDEHGCVPQSSGYQDCVKYAKKNALTLWCGEQSKKASDTFRPASDKAQEAYDEVMAEWDKVKNLPYYQRHPYEQYAADAKTKYNAIFKPAYATYVSKINSLNTQGCNEIIVYSDTSWAGY